MTFNTLKEKLPFLDSFVTVAPISLENEKIYHDARSAAFFAMGRTMKEKTTVGLALPGAYLASTYTAITEAWFQKVNVVVFAFYDKLSEVSTAWIDRCIVKSMTIGADEIDDSIDEIESCCGMNGPVLINIVGVKDDETSFDYRKWIDAIRQKEGNAKIRCYNAIQSDGIINIPSKDKYGVISKYIGMSVAVNVGYLLCTSECFLIDANVFRTRYANGNMKIILFDDGNLEKIDAKSWIAGNGWWCEVVFKDETTAVNWLIEDKTQGVLIVR